MRVEQAELRRSIVSLFGTIILIACAPSASDVVKLQPPPRAEHWPPVHDFQNKSCDPGPDSDQDGVPDWRDGCPMEPETNNGVSDEDGCPDKAYVMVREARPLVTNHIYFGVGSAELLGSQDLIVEGIASRLHGGPGKIRLLEIGGHADSQEADGWELAFRRAEVVRCRMTRYGVTSKILFARRYRAQPGDTQAATSPCGSNRYVAFTVIEYLNAL